MTSTTRRSLWQSLVALSAAATFAACADRAPIGPDDRLTSAASRADLTSAEAAAVAFDRLPELGSCEADVGVPAGSKLSFHVFATGVQIYHWDGTKWVFFNPAADLYADAGRTGLVGTHFGTPAGPAWLTTSGSRVVGTVTGRCTPNPTAIAWVRLDAVADGAGVFENTKFIQRLNTVGGIAPSAPGTFVGQETGVPYMADYFFYRAP
jgi:hypothetical protein